ncbi:MAG TPA: D-arabinono-1,4-lactone oxidase [Candidatus Dormibacteraeota bacterium]|jgi:hypothetical protein|nr:D-arabinono-1,4-lactone oxidase [Candidatus Dormibacteraeota bacterium]
MTCPSNSSVASSSPWLYLNWARTRPVLVPTLLKPNSKAELVTAVQQVEKSSGSVKAVGSSWSYSPAAVDESLTHVIDISMLNHHLPLAGEKNSIVPSALKPDPPPPPFHHPRPPHFVHVEAGITIYDLNFLLDDLSPRLAMPTLGGSNGQTLAGVISTGVHGADFNLPPIADFIRAIHLVGPGGQEWWLERSGANSITDPTRMMAIAADPTSTLLCPDITIEYDDQLFQAAMVSLGRFGVIYSVVLQAVPAFKLTQHIAASTWEGQTGEAMWLSNTAAVPGTTPVQGHFREIIVSPYANGAGTHDCMVTTREITTAPLNPQPASFDFLHFVCPEGGLNPPLIALMGTLPILIATATSAAIASISWMLAIPIVGAIAFSIAAPTVIAAATTALVTLETALATALSAGGSSLSDKIASICNMATLAGFKELVPALVGAFMTQQRSPTPPGTPDTVDDGFRLMTSQTDRSIPHAPRTPDAECLRHMDGFEFEFGLQSGQTDLFDFMNAVFALTEEFKDKNMPQGFGMSVRVTRGTSAFIGMQQSDRTAHVEIDCLRGLIGQDEFYSRLHATAAAHMGIPHWGLLHSLTAKQVDDIYGRNVVQWRQALARVINSSNGNVATFRSKFSIDRNLEPAAGCTIPLGFGSFFRKLQALKTRAMGFHHAFPNKPKGGNPPSGPG